jgi:hypothetical protein
MKYNKLFVKDAYYFKFYCHNFRTPICGSSVVPTSPVHGGWYQMGTFPPNFVQLSSGSKV